MNDTKTMKIYDNKGKETGEMLYWLCHKCGLLRANKYTHQHGEPLPQEVIDDIKIWEEKEYEKNKPQVSGETSESGVQ